MNKEFMVDGQNAALDDGSLEINSSQWIVWRRGDEKIELDGFFSADELMSLVMYMKHNR